MSLLGKARENLRGYDPTARPVLVVEDDAGLRAYLATILEGHGYRVVAAGSGEEALRLLGGEQAMLAVLDIGLPGMDGFAVAEHLAPDVPVLVVTGDPLKAKMKSYGRERFAVIGKPVTPDQIEAAVQALV
jgi:two-component system, OmpR family, response regulator